MQNEFSKNIMELRYSWDKENETKETWEDIATRTVRKIFNVILDRCPPHERLYWNALMKEVVNVVSKRKFIPGGRFLAQAGKDYHQVNNCFLLRASDTREGWGELVNKATVMLMSGGGIGVNYSELREKGAKLKRSGGVSSGPIPLMKTLNEIGRGVMAGGNRRSALWSGLIWSHPDIFEFIKIKDWSPEVRKLKEKDFDFPAAMDMTNISVILDKDFFDAYHDTKNEKHDLAQKIYWETIHQMLKKSEPGFSVDYENKNESLRNA